MAVVDVKEHKRKVYVPDKWDVCDGCEHSYYETGGSFCDVDGEPVRHPDEPWTWYCPHRKEEGFDEE